MTRTGDPRDPDRCQRVSAAVAGEVEGGDDRWNGGNGVTVGSDSGNELVYFICIFIFVHFHLANCLLFVSNYCIARYT